MSLQSRWWSRVDLLAVAVVLGLALWFRLSSLDTLPVQLGDESYYGVQAVRLAHGLSFRTHTTSGNLLDPFLVAAQAPLHWVFAPSVSILRLPVALGGLLAIGLLGRTAYRAWGPETALWAVVLMACLPIAIDFSRIGCEYGQTPLVGVVAASFALRGRGWGFLLTLFAALLVHPTNVFLVPILGPLFVHSTWTRWAHDPAARARALRRIALVSVSLIVLVTIALARRPIVQAKLDGLADRLQTLEWGTFFLAFLRASIRGLWPRLSPSQDAWASLAVGLVLVLGGGAFLVRRRRWDQLALGAGTLAGLVLLHVLAGSHVFVTESRYGAVLITPAVLCVACLATAASRVSTDRLRQWPRLRHAMGAALVGALLLWACRLNYFGGYEAATPGETVWTFGSDIDDPYRAVLEQARADVAQNRAWQTPSAEGRKPRPTLVLAEHYFVYTPLQYLNAGHRDLRVVELLTIPELGELVSGGDPLGRNASQMIQCVAEGDYVVQGDPILPALNQWVHRTLDTAYPNGRLDVWSSPTAPSIVLFRMRTPGQHAMAEARTRR